jgi:hypothetical protein
MDIRNRLFALAFMPVLGLFAVATLADVAVAPLPSANATNLLVGKDAQIKSANQCEGATFFKNAFPSLTNGTPGGTDFINFIVDGQTVRVDIEWYANNSFDIAVTGGWSPRIGVTIDTNHFIYESADPTVGITDPSLGFRDFGLNYYGIDVIADDVNHLDLCLEDLDSDGPDVSIRVDPSSDGTVSGLVSIIATVIDDSLVDPNLLTISIVNWEGTDVTPDYQDPPDFSYCDPNDPDPVCTEYTWPWDTSALPSGEYNITIDAVDLSVFANVGTGSFTVTVFNLKDCLEGDDGVTGGEGGIQGCNPTGFMWNELPEQLRDSGLLDGQTLTQAAVRALSSAQDDVCGGPVDPITGERPYPFVARDPRWGEITPGVYNPRPLDFSEIFNLSLVIPDPVADQVVMRADTRGEPCLALLYGEASFSFEDFYDGTVSLFGANRYTYAVTQLPEVPELGLPIPDDVGPLEPDGQIDLQRVPEATYSPTYRRLPTFIGEELGPFTSQVFNPARQKVPDWSYFALGTVQICESLLGSGLSPADGRPYYDAVLACSTDLAVEYFDDLDTLLTYVGEPDLPGYPTACLVDPSAENLRVELNKARSMVKVGDWTKADTRLNDLLFDVLQATWLVDDRNCPGHVVMRIENLLWRNAQLEYAESLLPAQ